MPSFTCGIEKKKQKKKNVKILETGSKKSLPGLGRRRNMERLVQGYKISYKNKV